MVTVQRYSRGGAGTIDLRQGRGRGAPVRAGAGRFARARPRPWSGQRADLRLALPLPRLGRGDEGLDVRRLDHAGVLLDPGGGQQRLAAAVGGDRLEVAEGVADEVQRRALAARAARRPPPRGSRRRRRRAPTACRPAGRRPPAACRRPGSRRRPWARRSSPWRPPRWRPACTASTASPSEPSATRMPTCRPSSVSFILPMSWSAGDGSRSRTGAAAGGALGSGSSARPAATRLARSSSMCRRCPTIASRMCRCATLESSKTSAEARCACSGGVWLR